MGVRLGVTFFAVVHFISVHHQTLEGVFRNKVEDKVENGYKVFVPAKSFCKIISTPGAHRGEYGVITCNFQEGTGGVDVALESEAPAAEAPAAE